MSAGRPLVALLVGTDHHPFDRVVGWAADLAATGEADWFVQHGTTPLPPGLEGSPLLTADALRSLLNRADAVITHGGPGLIMEARSLGHCPIVVARDPALGEHVDDHQQRFLEFISRRGLVTAAQTFGELSLATAATLTVGRDSLLGTSLTGSTTAARFGTLVDDLLHRA